VSKVIQVRNVPDDVHRELRRRAAEAGVALSDYVLEELRRVAGRSANAETLMRAAMRPGGASRAAIRDAVDDARTSR
jgi:hypothetical protein